MKLTMLYFVVFLSVVTMGYAVENRDSEYEYNGISLITQFDSSPVALDQDEPRKAKKLKLQECVKIADSFLMNTFGHDFKPPIFRVSLIRAVNRNGYFWCWSVVYYDPVMLKKNIKNIFAVNVSLDGKVLMKAQKKEKRGGGP